MSDDERRRRREWRWGYLAAALIAGATFAIYLARPRPAYPIEFQTGREGTVLLNICAPDNRPVRRLIESQRFPAGTHQLVWDGRADDGTLLEPREYVWRGLLHEGRDWKLRQWSGR